MAGLARRHLGDIAGGIAQFGLNALRAQGQSLAHRRQHHTTPRAQMHRRTDDPLDLGQKPRGRRLGDAHPVRSLPDLPRLGQSRKQAQVAEFQSPMGKRSAVLRKMHIISAINYLLCMF